MDTSCLITLAPRLVNFAEKFLKAFFRVIFEYPPRFVQKLDCFLFNFRQSASPDYKGSDAVLLVPMLASFATLVYLYIILRFLPPQEEGQIAQQLKWFFIATWLINEIMHIDHVFQLPGFFRKFFYPFFIGFFTLIFYCLTAYLTIWAVFLALVIVVVPIATIIILATMESRTVTLTDGTVLTDCGSYWADSHGNEWKYDSSTNTYRRV